MTIQYLQKLRDNNKKDGFTDEGLSLSEIAQLEQLCNNGNPFPQVLKELLFLAGNSCNYLDYSIYDSQQELQSEERLELQELYGITITRPYFFVDLSSVGLPAFIFLDEGDNPPLNHLENHPTQSNFYRRTGGTLQTLINSRIQNYLEGYNPF